MKKLLLFVAAVFTCATINAQESWSEIAISSGFNFDGICESADDAPTQRGPLDTHGSQLITEDVFGAVNYIPSDGYLELDNGHAYQFGAFDANNCLSLTKSSAYPTDVTQTTGTLTFSTPVSASNLGFLVVGTNKENYALTYNAVVIYEDNSEETFNLETGDWGQNPSDGVYKCNRWRVTAGSNPETGFSGSLCEQTVELTQSKKVKAVKFDYTIDTEDEWGWGYINIFGVCYKASTAGINDLTVDSNEAVKAVYTIDGRQVSEAQHGVNVVKMNNGKAKKIIKK